MLLTEPNFAFFHQKISHIFNNIFKTKYIHFMLKSQQVKKQIHKQQTHKKKNKIKQTQTLGPGFLRTPKWAVCK